MNGFWRRTRIKWFRDRLAALDLHVGAGPPEGVVPASVYSVYVRLDRKHGTRLFVKDVGTGPTGWLPMSGFDWRPHV